MIDRIDAILHIADLPALTAEIAASDPARVADAGGRQADDAAFDPATVRITGFAATPAIHAPPAALVYVRVSKEEAALWRGAAGVTVLASAPFAGSPRASADAVYGALFADGQAAALYDAVHDRTPCDVSDGDGGTITVTPPARFGMIG